MGTVAGLSRMLLCRSQCISDDGGALASPTRFMAEVQYRRVIREETDNVVGCGGVCRGSSGCWLLGFSINLGTSSVLWAELWAILIMLTLAWDKGFSRVMVKSDSRVVVLLINNGCGPFHPYASIVNQIRNWMSKSWEIRCIHTWREANQVANCLANFARDLGLGTHVWEVPPRGV